MDSIGSAVVLVSGCYMDSIGSTVVLVPGFGLGRVGSVALVIGVGVGRVGAAILTMFEPGIGRATQGLVMAAATFKGKAKSRPHRYGQ